MEANKQVNKDEVILQLKTEAKNFKIKSPTRSYIN